MALHRLSLRHFNPYNEIGVIHNNALDHFVKHAPATFTQDDIVQLCIDSVLSDTKSECRYLASDLIRLKGIAGTAFNTMYLADQRCNPNFIPVNVDAIIAFTNLNPIQAALARQLLNPSTELSLVQYSAIVVSVEAEIFRSIRNIDEQFPLLAATAVARATVMYWSKQIEDPRSPWGPVIANRRWWKYVLADVGGGLGGIGGGPVGVGVGAAVGTISYAIADDETG